MKTALGFSITASLLCVASSHAAIVAVGGDAQLISAPVDARLNALTSNDYVRVWNEKQAFTLATNLRVDAVSPGTYNGAGDLGVFNIAGGTTVNSHYIHFDSPGSTRANAEGFVTFDAVILGVICVGDANSTAKTLDNSDFLGAPTLYSNNVNNRGLELSANGDNFTISNDGLSIRFNFAISSPGDYMRVITAVPTPGSLAILGLASLGTSRRRRIA